MCVGGISGLDVDLLDFDRDEVPRWNGREMMEVLLLQQLEKQPLIIRAIVRARLKSKLNMNSK